MTELVIRGTYGGYFSFWWWCSFCLDVIHIFVSRISQSLVTIADLETLFSLFFSLSDVVFVFLVSVPGRPVLDVLDGFLESKDTVEVSLFSVFCFYLLAAFCNCFSVFSTSDSFLYLASLKCHVSSVLIAALLVARFGAAAAAYDLSATVGVAISTSFLASWKESLLCTLTCWTCFSNFHRGHSREYAQWFPLQLAQMVSFVHVLLSWSGRPQQAQISLPRHVFCPCPNLGHLKQRKGFGMKGSTGILR